jgi:hypothetical protein
LSGSNSLHNTCSDCINTDFPELYVEVKLRAAFLHHTLFKDVYECGKKEMKTPVLVTHVKNEKSELVTIRIEDFIELLQKKSGVVKK